MYYVEIILNVPLNGSFTYSTEDPSVQVGIRAEVFFGRRKMTGFVVSVSDEYDEKKNAGLSKDKIKPVIRFIDKTPLFSKEQTEQILPLLCRRSTFCNASVRQTRFRQRQLRF